MTVLGKRIRWTALILLALAITLIAAACGSTSDSTSDVTAQSDETAATVAASAPAEAPASEGGLADGDEGARSLGTGGLTPVALQTVDLGRDIIFTADLTVGVSDVATAGAEAARVVTDLGGFLFGQQTTGDPEPFSVLTFKVPPETFQEALSRLGAIGELRTQNVSADDVTERVVDLESRISTAEASVERLKSFLDEANDIVTITELEEQLLERETQLETLRGQLRTIRDRVDLATIVLTLTEALARPAVAVQVTAYPGHDAGLSCPGDGRVAVDKGEDATVCITITNAGDTPLTDVTVADAVLGVDLTDLVVVFGDPAGVILPGQSIDLAAEVSVDRSVRTQTRVTATPVDDEGREIESRSVATTESISLDGVDPGGLPGFSDGLTAAVDVLSWVGGVIVVSAGFVLPFIWVLVLVGVWVWWWRRRRSRPAEAALPPPPLPEEEEPVAV